jgi:hypothetical protein
MTVLQRVSMRDTFSANVKDLRLVVERDGDVDPGDFLRCQWGWIDVEEGRRPWVGLHASGFMYQRFLRRNSG